jgi:hypothetical protein
MAAGLPGREAIVFAAQYLAQPLYQALRLGDRDDRVYGVANYFDDAQSLDWKACCQAGRRLARRSAGPLAIVLIPSDILGWPVYPTICITLCGINPRLFLTI